MAPAQNASAAPANPAVRRAAGPEIRNALLLDSRSKDPCVRCRSCTGASWARFSSSALAGSAAYAVAEAFGIRGSLELPASRAIGFYAIVGAATFAGGTLAATNIDPIAMLFWTAVINGIVAVPIMIAMMLVVVRAKGTRSFGLPWWLKLLGWLASALMAIAVGLLLWSSLS